MNRRESEFAGRFEFDYEGEYIDTEEGRFVSLRDLLPEEAWSTDPGRRGTFRVVVEFEPAQ